MWYKPYSHSFGEKRHRTRSENNDVDPVCASKPVVEEAIAALNYEFSQLKKAKSLESIIAENNRGVDLAEIVLPEMEVVSDCIQKLSVGD